MIIDEPLKAREDTLTALRKSEHSFFLGGSRRMAQLWPGKIEIGPGTDWDFYAEENPKLLDFLYDLGFVSTKTPIEYFDSECISILKHELDNIQVVIRRDPGFYQSVFESISPEFYATFLWKSSPIIVDVTKIQMIFNQLFETAREK